MTSIIDTSEVGYKSRKSAGIAQATKHAPTALVDLTDALIKLLLMSRVETHCGELWAFLDNNYHDICVEMQAWKYMVNSRWGIALGRGLCERTGKKKRTVSKNAHQVNNVWLSRVHRHGYKMEEDAKAMVNTYAANRFKQIAGL